MEPPTGASDPQKFDFWDAIANTVMTIVGVTPGFDVKMMHAKAEGQEIFNDAIKRCERRAMVAIAGQEVTTTGGVGFANAEIFQVIASSKVGDTGSALASTLNAQALPPVLRWAARPRSAMGLGVLGPEAHTAQLAYNTTPPQQRKVEAESQSAVSAAVEAMTSAGYDVNLEEVRAANRLPAAVSKAEEGASGVKLSVTDAKIYITVDQALAAAGQPPHEDPAFGALTLQQAEALAEAQGERAAEGGIREAA